MKIFLISFFLSLSVFAGAEKFDHFFYQNGCHLFSAKGTLVKTLPGQFCIPLADGRVISGSMNSIRMIGTDKSIQWETPVLLHHQMNLSADGKRILALDSEVVEENGVKHRYDAFVVLSLDGEVLHKNTIRLLTKEFVNHPIDQAFAEFFGNAKREHSHLNSIFEIGPLKKSGHPAFKEGNIIVNGLYTGFYVLTPDLKTVLYHAKLAGSQDHHVHDVKVLDNGKVLLFNNDVINAGNQWQTSALQEIDPATMKISYSFSGEKDIPIFSSHCGGVQKLDDEFYFISHMINGSYLFSRKTGKVMRSMLSPYNQFGKLWLVQNVRMIELSETFKKVWDL